MSKIKIFLCASWTHNFNELLDSYKNFTPKKNGIWNDIEGTTNINEADWVVVLDDLNQFNLNLIQKFDKNKIICLPRESARTNPYYLNTNIKYKFTYNDIIHVWSCNTEIKKNFDDLINLEYKEKKKLCSTVTSRLNLNVGIYQERINFIKKLSKQNNFKDKIDIFGYNWTKKELGDMYKGTLDGFNTNLAHTIENFKPNSTKFDALYDYSYNIAIENCVLKNYFTEKITDAILSWNIPIYYGCPNISDYFPKDSYYYLDINSPDCFERLKEILETPITQKNIDALKVAREKILYKYNVWNVLEKIIQNQELY